MPMPLFSRPRRILIDWRDGRCQLARSITTVAFETIQRVPKVVVIGTVLSPTGPKHPGELLFGAIQRVVESRSTIVVNNRAGCEFPREKRFPNRFPNAEKWHFPWQKSLEKIQKKAEKRWKKSRKKPGKKVEKKAEKKLEKKCENFRAGKPEKKRLLRV
jgi:hypothetical protein